MEALRFTGSGSEYFKIWIVNVLLTIITLGMYYPWAKVRNKRYFYANTNLADRNFEYHATGKQLFVGFLIAMVLFILYVVLGQLHPLNGSVLMFVLFIALPWLIWRSLMFNMKVTSFSNVHFSFKGKLKQAYINFFAYPLLLVVILLGVNLVSSIVITKLILNNDNLEWLGNVMPFILIVTLSLTFYLGALIKKKNTEYVLNGSRYGQGIFTTNLEIKKFMMIMLKTIGIVLLIMIIVGIIAMLLGVGEEHLIVLNPENLKNEELPQGFFVIIAALYISMIFVMILVMTYNVTRQRTYIYANTILDNKISFESTLRARDLAWVMISNLFLMVITIGLAFPWAKVRMARLMLENTLVDTSVGFDEYITQKQNEESSLGDQIGDAFDVDVGVAF